jgi:hypothetical protein
VTLSIQASAASGHDKLKRIGHLCLGGTVVGLDQHRLMVVPLFYRQVVARSYVSYSNSAPKKAW